MQEKETSSEIARELFGKDKHDAKSTVLAPNNSIKSTLNSNQKDMHIAPDTLVLSPEKMKEILHVAKQPNSENESLPFDDEPDYKESSRDTYVVDEPTISEKECVMESNQVLRKDSFLMETVMEDNFSPPNPANTKYCSTAQKKDGTRGDSQEFSGWEEGC